MSSFAADFVVDAESSYTSLHPYFASFTNASQYSVTLSLLAGSRCVCGVHILKLMKKIAAKVFGRPIATVVLLF